MLKNPQDTRARRTERQFEQALLELLARKPLHQITVAELCRRCQVNRATFYDHYTNLFALADAVEDGILARLEALMAQIERQRPSADAISELFFAFLGEFRQPLRLLLSGETAPRFFQKLDGALLPFFEKRVRQSYHIAPGCPPGQLQAVLRFLTSGYYGFFLQAMGGADMPPQLPQLAAQISDRCLSGFFQSRPAAGECDKNTGKAGKNAV